MWRTLFSSAQIYLPWLPKRSRIWNGGEILTDLKSQLGNLGLDGCHFAVIVRHWRTRDNVFSRRRNKILTIRHSVDVLCIHESCHTNSCKINCISKAATPPVKDKGQYSSSVNSIVVVYILKIDIYFIGGTVLYNRPINLELKFLNGQQNFLILEAIVGNFLLIFPLTYLID